MITDFDEFNSFLSEAQSRMDELDEKLQTVAVTAAQFQNTLATIDHRLSKCEKTLNGIGSIKIYRDLIQKDLKNLSKDLRKIESELTRQKRKTHSNRSDLKALTKVLRLQLKKQGIYPGKKASLKKICSLITCRPYVSPRISEGGDGIEL